MLDSQQQTLELSFVPLRIKLCSQASYRTKFKEEAAESLESLPDDLQSSPTNSLLCALHIYVCLDS